MNVFEHELNLQVHSAWQWNPPARHVHSGLHLSHLHGFQVLFVHSSPHPQSSVHVRVLFLHTHEILHPFVHPQPFRFL